MCVGVWVCVWVCVCVCVCVYVCVCVCVSLSLSLSPSPPLSHRRGQADRTRLREKIVAVNLSITWVPHHFCQTLRQWVELSLCWRHVSLNAQRSGRRRRRRRRTRRMVKWSVNLVVSNTPDLHVKKPNSPISFFYAVGCSRLQNLRLE